MRCVPRGEAGFHRLVALLLSPTLSLAYVDQLAAGRLQILLDLLCELGGGDHVAGEL